MRSDFRSICRALALCTLSLLASLPAHAEVLQYHPNSPAYIGGNFDPAYPGRAYPECLVRTTVRGESILPDHKPGTAAATQFFIRTVKSRRELYRLLNVSVAVSGSYGLFSADFSGSLEQENTFKEETFTWVIYGYSSYGKFVLEKIELTPEAKQLANNPVGFRNRCGTDYVQIEQRAVQAAAVFTIKNLSESQRKVLEASFSASYGGGGPLSISGDAKYSEFVKTAAAYGQIEVNVYAIGGPGVAALSPIIGQVEKPVETLKIIQDYFSSLTLDQSAAVAYNTGSLQSLINRPSIESDIFHRFVAEQFLYYEDLTAEKARLRNILQASQDWGITNKQAEGIKAEIQSIEALQQVALRRALNCKNAFTDVTAEGIASRRGQCDPASLAASSYDRKFGNLQPKPYYLRYFVSNELIPGEEVMNFSVRAPTLKTVTAVKKLDPTTNTFEALNGVQVHDTKDGSRQAGTSILMKDILATELPVGLKIELDSGRTYLEMMPFSPAPPVQTTIMKIRTSGIPDSANPAREKASYESGNLVPSYLQEKW